MDHHLMHHADMDMGHGGHGGHGDMDMGQCDMNMLFTWSTKNLCIVFPQWRVTGAFSLFVSLVVIVLLTAGYEGIRQATRVYEARYKQRLGVFGATNVTGNDIADESATATATATVSAALPAPPHIPSSQATHDHVLAIPDESSPLLVAGRDQRRVVERKGKIIMATLYAVQVFYSFFIMLLFMTYNGFVMLAVAVGAFVGYLVFGQDTSAAKTVACH